MNEAVMRELLAKQEKYFTAMCKAKDEFLSDQRQIVEMMLKSGATVQAPLAQFPSDPPKADPPKE
jgi:hypothetical protein